METRVKEKLDNDARRKVGKQYGFKQSSWCNWLIKDDYFFYIVHGTFTKDADLYVKPCYYDDILWNVVPEADAAQNPQSYRAIGSFTAPDFLVSKNTVPLEEDADFTEKNCISVWKEIFSKVHSQIEEFLSKNPDVEEFTFINNDSIGRLNDETLVYMLQLIYHKQYQEAEDYAKKLLEHEVKGCYCWVDKNDNYKYINEYIIDYCRAQNMKN